MRRVLVVTVAVVLGVAFGGVATMLVADRGASSDGAPSPATAALVTPAADVRLEAVPAPTGDAAAAGPQVLLAWTAGGLPAGFVAEVEALPETDQVAVVRGGTLDLVVSRDATGMEVDAAPPGMAYPLDAVAVDPTTYPEIVPVADQQTFRGLLPGEALLGSTSAELRGLGPGGQLVLADGSTLVVAGVVDDALVGAAEVVVPAGSGVGAGDALGLTTERYVLFTTEADRELVDERVRAAAGEVAVRIRAPGETPYLRSSDAVLPQVLIKQVFGEFAYRGTPGDRTLVQEPGWSGTQIVVEEVPLLGAVRCHRSLLPALRGAMAELAERNLGGLVGSFDGCFNPRLVAVGGSISRHAWGAAVDLNFSSNRTGESSVQDDRLVAVMERWGFVSGDDWLVPDSGHFEYVGPPDPVAS